MDVLTILVVYFYSIRDTIFAHGFRNWNENWNENWNGILFQKRPLLRIRIHHLK